MVAWKSRGWDLGTDLKFTCSVSTTILRRIDVVTKSPCHPYMTIMPCAQIEAKYSVSLASPPSHSKPITRDMRVYITMHSLYPQPSNRLLYKLPSVPLGCRDALESLLLTRTRDRDDGFLQALSSNYRRRIYPRTTKVEGRSCSFVSYVSHLTICNMKSTFIATTALAGLVSASLYGESKLNHTCVLQPPYLSCSAQANPATVDSCCVETFGGLFVQTQFWDTYTGLEAQGQLLPAYSWVRVHHQAIVSSLIWLDDSRPLAGLLQWLIYPVL